MSITMTAPMDIPVPTPRSNTPVSLLAKRDYDQPEGPNRPRSDTICTTSSTSSAPSFELHTPQTPSILHVLQDGLAFPSQSEMSGTRRRKGSFGFGTVSGSSGTFSSSLGTPFEVEVDQLHVVSSNETAAEDRGDQEDEVEVDQSLQTTSSVLLPPYPPSANQTLPPPLMQSRSSFTAAVRRKLERSKSSFRTIKQQSRPDSPAFSDGASTDGEQANERPRKHRLKRLLRSLSYTGSTISLHSVTSSIQAEWQQERLDHHRESEIAPTVPAGETRVSAAELNDDGVISRDFGRVPWSSDPSTSVANPEPDETPSALRDHEDQGVAGLLTVRRSAKGKERARRMLKTRPALLPAWSTGPPSAHHALSRPPTTPIISRPRAKSMPYFAASASASESSVGQDLFGRLLPREIQVMILKTLVETWTDSRKGERWDGDVGGRRELLRLSRVSPSIICSQLLLTISQVSRSWQSLCLDGQLWTLCDLSPFSSVLHPRLLHRIVASTAPFISTLSLRGMDHLDGSVLIPAVCQASSLASLTSIDLRGCRSLVDQDICRLIKAAPNLTAVNLSGVQAASTAVVRTIAKHCQRIERIDISRCWDISLCDVAVWLRSISNEAASTLRVLKVGGIKGYSPTALDFLPLVASRLVNLESLDVQGCPTLFDTDFEAFARAIDTHAVDCTLLHLNISNCSSLTNETLIHLKDRLPMLEKLEMASMSQIFGDQDHGREEKPLIEFLRSVPRLQRLDLEGTGTSGQLTDRTLSALTPARAQQGDVIGKEISELCIGYATGITADGLIRLIRGCDNLCVLEADVSDRPRICKSSSYPLRTPRQTIR